VHPRARSVRNKLEVSRLSEPDVTLRLRSTRCVLWDAQRVMPAKSSQNRLSRESLLQSKADSLADTCKGEKEPIRIQLSIQGLFSRNDAEFRVCSNIPHGNSSYQTKQDIAIGARGSTAGHLSGKEALVRSKLVPLVLALFLFPACSEEPARLSLEISGGQESDAFSMDPPVARVEIRASSLDGSVDLRASTTPGGTFDLGEVPVDALMSFEVTGSTSEGAVVMRGRSLSGIPMANVTGTLRVFVQRTGMWARPPGGLSTSHVGGVSGVLDERYLLLSGGSVVGEGDPAESNYYDLLAWGGALGGALPRRAESLVMRGTRALLIASDGASWVDFSAGTSTSAALPAGLASFGQIAGGQVVEASDGTSFVVGPTRSSGATKAVLVVNADEGLGVTYSREARSGAAAIWMEGTGLVVAGGSATGAGVEVLSPGATAFVDRGYASDAVEGAAAVLTGAGDVALVGGVEAGVAAPTRRVVPSCTSGCDAAVVGGAELPVALLGVRAYALAGGRALAIGHEAAGEGLMRSFVVDFSGSVNETPLREARRGASITPAPNGTLAILGGEHADGSAASSVEMFFPE